MNDADRQQRRIRGSARPVAAGTPGEEHEARTGQSIDSLDSPSASQPVGNLVVPVNGPVEPDKPIKVHPAIHRAVKTEAARQGKKLNEFVEPKLLELLPPAIAEALKRLLCPNNASPAPDQPSTLNSQPAP